MQIQAAVVREKAGPFSIEELELEGPRSDEVLVRIAGCGVCHTDLVCRDQYFPVPLPCVFGHEGSGVVEDVGSAVTKVSPGDHVVLSYRSCGQCSSCRTGRPAYCLDFFACNCAGVRKDGSTALSAQSESIHGNFFGQSSFASHVLAAESNTVKVTHDVPLEILGPLGCCVQTGAGAVINALDPPGGTSIAIFGVGSVGMSAVMAAKVVGLARIIAVDIEPARLEQSRKFGATDTINSSNEDAVEAIQSLMGSGVEFSLECAGLPHVLRQAVDCLTLTGVCGLVGVAPLGTECPIDMYNILSGRTLRGVIEGDSVPDLFIPRLIELYRQGRFPFDEMITFYSLDEINRAVTDSESGKVLKAVLRP